MNIQLKKSSLKNNLIKSLTIFVSVFISTLAIVSIFEEMNFLVVTLNAILSIIVFYFVEVVKNFVKNA